MFKPHHLGKICRSDTNVPGASQPVSQAGWSQWYLHAKLYERNFIIDNVNTPNSRAR